MSKPHVGTRLEPEEICRIDALIGPMGSEGRELVRSKVIRLLILKALPLAEAECVAAAEKGVEGE